MLGADCFCRPRPKGRPDTAGDQHGAEEAQVAQTTQDDGHKQAQEEQPQMSGADWEKAVAELVFKNGK